MSKAQKLSIEMLNDFFCCDPELGLLFWKERPREMFTTKASWASFNSRCANKPCFFTVGNHGYKTGRVLGIDILAHRLIWALAFQEWPTGEIDHIDGDRLNNSISNLRDVKRSTNGQNIKRSTRNSSGRTGVSFNKAQGKWAAYIQSEGIYSHLGLFPTMDQAVAARVAAEAKHGFHKNHGTG